MPYIVKIKNWVQSGMLRNSTVLLCQFISKLTSVKTSRKELQIFFSILYTKGAVNPQNGPTTYYHSPGLSVFRKFLWGARAGTFINSTELPISPFSV